MCVLLNDFLQSKYTYGTSYNKIQNITCITNDPMASLQVMSTPFSSMETMIMTSTIKG